MDASFYRCKQILIIDDCAPVRTSIKAMAQQIGFESIHLARDANEAIAKCLEIPFDFILSDFNLGDGKDGYQLFESLKTQQLLAPMGCFIMISAENQRQIVHGMIELQPDDYLLKPFTFQQLEHRISRAIKNRIALRKIYLNLFDNDYKNAITECENVVTNKPEFAAAALRIKGELLLTQKQYAAAETFYQQVLQRQKTLAWARLGHAVACFYQERWDDTELQLADLTQFDETKVEALDWLSRLYVKYRRFQIAHDTLTEAALLSPKNIVRLKTLANLASIIGDKQASSRINSKIVATARHSINDIAENYLNQARSLVDAAYCGNVLERAVTINNAAKIVDHLAKRFDADKIKAEITILRSRFLAAKAELIDAKQLISEIPLSYQQNITIDSCMDAAKAYFELGDLYASQIYIDKLQHILDRDDFLTETQRIMLEMEQSRHEDLKAKLKVINAEAAEAYQREDFNTAFDRFAETFDYMPTNPAIAINLMQTMIKGARVTDFSQRYVRAAVKLLARSELDDDIKLRFKRYLSQIKEMHPEMIPRRRPKEREVL
ncbi:tetratricopeptide repeat-containing response regulator [Rheinheimera maricola]|uniref:Response regulator n=1 Tax=Rheinheimera maricola TaxID=2793282 RepID=A0ABS7X4D7_9GAMM|nr:tetratricopeptide repeat-containing response regulator [Rheinheimera maricola]MBZ9610406.1 response regulator [Rheinheimera maricola]